MRYSKILNLLFLLVLLSDQVFSQERSIFDNSYLQPFITNPAFTGIEYYPVGQIGVKKQWLGFPDAPESFQISGNIRIGSYDFYDPKGYINTGPLNIKDRLGLGAALFQDKNGPLTNTGGLISYGYHIPLKNNSGFSLGLSVILLHYGMNTSILKPDQSNDPYLLMGNNSISNLNFGVGTVYRIKNYYFGASINKLINNKLDSYFPKANYPSFFLTGGTKLYKNSNHFNIEPSFVIKNLGSNKLFLDLNTKIYIQRMNWIAFSYSTLQRLNFRFGLRLYKNTYIAYNYELSLGKIASYNYGTHEIILGINIGLSRVEGLRRSNN